MSYDTEHVRNAPSSSGMITGVPTFTELLANTDLAALYTSIRHEAPVTAPELVETATVSKKTVYDYLDRLQRAGLVTETGVESGVSVYEAEDFELTLTVRNVAVSITPELVEVVAHTGEYPVIERVLDDHGLVTFALAQDLVKAHSDGDVTIRQIARLTELSPGTTYDLVEAVYEIHGLGDEGSAPTTFTPDDIVDEDAPVDGSLDE